VASGINPRSASMPRQFQRKRNQVKLKFGGISRKNGNNRVQFGDVRERSKSPCPLNFFNLVRLWKYVEKKFVPNFFLLMNGSWLKAHSRLRKKVKKYFNQYCAFD
jgi:hypothetical protein